MTVRAERLSCAAIPLVVAHRPIQIAVFSPIPGVVVLSEPVRCGAVGWVWRIDSRSGRPGIQGANGRWG